VFSRAYQIRGYDKNNLGVSNGVTRAKRRARSAPAA
jgi:hypothetical protein